MTFDLSSLFWIFVAIMVLEPLFMTQWHSMRRAHAIRAIERSHGSRVITMIHRQEKRSLFGFTDLVRLRSAVWTGDTRDTRPISDFSCHISLRCEAPFRPPVW
jgi:hypothetical protein